MNDDYQVLTPENVLLQYDVAGLGSRVVAALIDQLIVWVSFLILFAAGTFLIAFVESFFLPPAALQSSIAIGLVLSTFWVWWGYFLLFEMLWNGQTPGKRLGHLRVV